MKTLAVLVLFSFFLSPKTAFAQAGLIPGANDPSKADLRALNSDERLAHVVITPQDKTLDYYVVGKKEGEIDFNNLRLFKTQMSPASAPSEEPARHKPAPVAKTKVEPTVMLVRQRYVRHNTISHSSLKVPRSVRSISTIVSRNRGHSPFSDKSFLLALLALLCFALYAHRTSLKVRMRQAPRASYL